MSYTNNSKRRGGSQKRLFDKRCVRRQCYRKINHELRDMLISPENIDKFIASVQSGEVKIDNADLEQRIITLGKIDKDIANLERKLNSLTESASEPGMS